MSIMTHNGYSARVEYDARDSIFVGRVLGVRDQISFHGETVKDLVADFHAAVEHYLQVCKRRNIAPEKPYSGKLILRVPPEIHAAAAVAAEAAGASLNQWASAALGEAAGVKARK